jgi:hypothetical protein
MHVSMMKLTAHAPCSNLSCVARPYAVVSAFVKWLIRCDDCEHLRVQREWRRDKSGLCRRDFGNIISTSATLKLVADGSGRSHALMSCGTR